jgi:WD40 repeat protein
MARRASKLLEISAALAAMLLAVSGILIALVYFDVVRFQSLSDDYPSSELILNSFDQQDLWEPLCVSPAGEHLVAPGFKKLSWFANWNDKNRATREILALEFGERVESAAFSKDGRFIAIYVRAPREDTIAVFDAQDRKLMTKWPTSRSLYDIQIVFSDDDKMLFTNPTEGANVSRHLSAITGWEISTGKLLSSIKTATNMYLADFTFSEGRLLIAYEDSDDYKEIKICESEQPYSKTKCVASIKAPGATSFDGVRFSADGRRVAVGSHHAQPMRVYAVPDGRLIAQLEKAQYAVFTARFPGFAFSQNGKLLAVTNSGGSATLWSVDDAKELAELPGLHYSAMDELVFGPDSKTLITRDYHAVVIWDISGFVRENK